MKKALTPVLVTVIIGLFLWAIAALTADTALNLQKKGYLNVTGYAKERITSDLGYLEATIVTEGKKLKGCYKKLAEDRDKIRKFLKEQYSVADDEFEMRHASIKEIYKKNNKGIRTSTLDKYILEQSLKIESADVKKITKVASGLIDIVGEGVRISIDRPVYVYTKLDDLKVEMIARASRNARERVKAVTKNGRVRLGPIASVRIGVFQITPVHSTRVSDYGINDTTTIEKEIKSVVGIKYFVK